MLAFSHQEDELEGNNLASQSQLGHQLEWSEQTFNVEKEAITMAPATGQGQDPQAEMQASAALIAPQAPPQVPMTIPSPEFFECLNSGVVGSLAVNTTSIPSASRYASSTAADDIPRCLCSSYSPGLVEFLGPSFWASLTPVCECGHSPEEHHLYPGRCIGLVIS